MAASPGLCAARSAHVCACTLAGSRMPAHCQHRRCHEGARCVQGMMKTASGRRLARQRTAYMRDYLDRFEDEWYCRM